MQKIDFQEDFWQKSDLIYDSRRLISGADTLFFAFQGRYHDGHQFLEAMYAKGVRCFVVRHLPAEAETQFPGAQFRVVENPLRAMQQLAAFHRKKFTIPVVGITGSNGKTIVKEWLYTLLSPDLRVVKSPKSYNSQIGVPLSVWQMRPHHDLALFEAGISRPNEMNALHQIIAPTIGIFTNIGPAHDEGFPNRHTKVVEKMHLFAGVQALIYRADYALVTQEAHAQLPHVQQYSWGTAPEALWHFSSRADTAKSSHVTLRNRHTQQSYAFALPFADEASVENATHCILLLLWLGKSERQIQERLGELQNLPMRLELKEGKQNNLLIDDAYSNDALSLRIALDFLQQHQQDRRATILLSDLQQTGLPAEVLYPEIAHWFAQRNIFRLWGVGPEISLFASAFPMPEKRFFPTTEALLEELAEIPFHNEIILLKGARSFRFERISKQLQQQLHGTRLEINLEALVHNLKFFKSFLHRDTKVMAMVKAFAYGSGSHQVADVLQHHGVDYLAVAYADEGVRLRQKGIQLPIMVMNPLPETYELLLTHRLEPEVYSLSHVRTLLSFLREQPLSAPFLVHLKIETGMHRLGFLPEELPALCQLLAQCPQVRVASAFSHLAAADDPAEEAFSRQQIALFQEAVANLQVHLGYPFLRHILNSAGIVRYPTAQMDMVRLGIGLYGIEVNHHYPNALQTVGTLKTNISQIKTLKSGDTVGYGRHGVAQAAMRVGTIAIGYADGFDRRFSRGVGKVWVNGQFAPVVGNVCMDMSMIDLTHIAAHEGDEVVVFGEPLPVSEVAASIGTIPYELLTNVKDRVRRVFYIA